MKKNKFIYSNTARVCILVTLPWPVALVLQCSMALFQSVTVRIELDI